MKHLKLFESFEIVEPIKYGEPLNNKEINFLKECNIMCPEWILKDDGYYYIHDHRCENIKDLPLTYIHGLCSKFYIQNYTINDDYSIDVMGSVNISNKKLTKIPLKFNKVSGDFYCTDNNLNTLEGSPESVGWSFYCGENNLTTLKGGPEEVGREFRCSFNQLTTLEGCPKRVDRDFFCSNNQLTTLEGGPEFVGGDFYCYNNPLTSVEYPEFVGGNFICRNNPLTSVEYKGIIKGKLYFL